jgi:hypothetical protein
MWPDRLLLYQSASAVAARTRSGAGHMRFIVMLFRSCPPLVARVQQGGAGGVNITARRPERLMMFTPSPPGADTVRPADLIGQLHSR